VDQRSLPLPSIHLPAAIDKALTSSDRTFWIACPLSHRMTPQALVPSIGRKVSSATIRRGMRLPEHFHKLVKLCRLRKKQRFPRLIATFRSSASIDCPVASPGFADPNIFTHFSPRHPLLGNFGETKNFRRERSLLRLSASTQPV
jgi:hypothetical protein